MGGKAETGTGTGRKEERTAKRKWRKWRKTTQVTMKRE
jgi:hypothetical protein